MGRLTYLCAAGALLVAGCAGGLEPTTTSTLSATTQATTTSTAAPTSTVGTGGNNGSVGARQGFTAAAALGIGDEYFPTLGNPGYDVTHYTLDLVFDPETTRLDGVATIDAVAIVDLEQLNLDFSVLEARAVLVDGRDAEFVAVEEDLVIVPPARIPTGESFVVDVEYGGSPRAARSGAVPFGIGWTTSGAQNYVVAEPDAAHTWFPSNDHPLDKATYTFRLTVPDEVIAAANGTLVDRITDLGQSTWVWEMAFPMATYLATVVIGDFTLVEDTAASAQSGVAIRHVLPAGTSLDDWRGLERLGEMVAMLAELYGPYPFDTYGIAIVDGFGAALENQTLSLFDRGIAQSAFFEDVLIHELAHQWFGDSVSPGRWQDIWLNEGFASYAEWLWIERRDGRRVLEQEIDLERSRFAAAMVPPPGAPPVDALFGAGVYRIGAMTLHALRLTVGDDAFFEILRTYHARFAGGTARTTDFIDVAEEVSGEDLGPLFDAWLFELEVPEFPSG